MVPPILARAPGRPRLAPRSTGLVRTEPRISGAASRRLAALVAGPVRRGRVVHSGPDAVYVEAGAAYVGVLARDAVQVPCGIRTVLPGLDASSGSPIRLVPGDPVVLGDGLLRIGDHVQGLEVVVRRLVSCEFPVTLDEVPDPAPLRTALGAHLDAVHRELPKDALAGLRYAQPSVVRTLLGRGSGLTPLGDDVLAGWLAAARVVEHPGRASMVTAVSRSARQGTTGLSAALLACASAGEAVPQFWQLVWALESGDDGRCARAVRDLLSIGHTSGLGLALGCLLALESAGADPA